MFSKLIPLALCTEFNWTLLTHGPWTLKCLVLGSFFIHLIGSLEFSHPTFSHCCQWHWHCWDLVPSWPLTGHVMIDRLTTLTTYWRAGLRIYWAATFHVSVDKATGSSCLEKPNRSSSSCSCFPRASARLPRQALLLITTHITVRSSVLSESTRSEH